MAPEVFIDPSKSRTIKYDVYGFGIVLWELLSGQKPYANGKDMFWSNLYQIYKAPGNHTF